MKHVLLIEDDRKLAELLAKLVQAEGFALQVVSSQKEFADLRSASTKFDVIVLDRLVDGADMKDHVPELKSRWSNASILVLSAINTPIERAELINLGVDDYMGKPFLSQELLARLKALARRSPSRSETYRRIGNSVLDFSRRTLMVDGRSDSLPAKEYLLLRSLTDEVGRVLSRNELLDVVWGINYQAETNVVEATVTNLRKRLNQIGSDIQIKNMRNSGYFVEG